MKRPQTLLDTCCIINFCAIDRPPVRLFGEFPFRWQIARSVEAEQVSIRPHENALRHERLHVNLQPCFSAGVFTRCDIEGNQETALYVNLTSELQDGEAMSLAIAASRRWDVATDDIPARKVAARLGVKAFGTPELLRIWAEDNRVNDSELSTTIARIEKLARFIPNLGLPEAQWWLEHRDRTSPGLR